MTETTVKHILTDDEIARLGPHAGHLAREIALRQEARRKQSAEAKREIDELQAELDDVHAQLRNGYRMEPAQLELLDDQEPPDQPDGEVGDDDGTVTDEVCP